MADGKWEEAQQLTLVHNEQLHENLEADPAYYSEYTRLVEKNRRMPMVPNMEEEEDDWVGPSGKGGPSQPVMSAEDMEAQAKAKAAELIAKLMGEAEQEVARAKMKVHDVKTIVPVLRPEPEPEPKPAVKKPVSKPKAAVPLAELPVIEIDDTFVPPPSDEKEKSGAEMKEELRQRNMAAAREAADRKARRQQAIEKKRLKAEEMARRRDEMRQQAARKASVPDTPAAIAAPEAEDGQEAEEENHIEVAAGVPASAVPKGLVPPPKFRPPKKGQKGLMPTLQKQLKEHSVVVWVCAGVAVLGTMIHFLWR